MARKEAMDIDKMELKVAVIIPFFQREKGLLRKAVLSVLGQVNFSNYDIIIVDDGSPVSAEEELRDLSETHSNLIRIIKQKNSGPGAARNRGLDSVSSETKYVAFLDSDDEWLGSHLENAVFALEKGYDFYFSNLIRHDRKASFERLINLEKHVPVDGVRQLFEYGSDLFDNLIQEPFILTLTVVYNYKKFPHLRFCEKLFNGQDYLFWLDLSLLARKVIFSMKIECVYGCGINIRDSLDYWGAEGRIKLISNDIKTNKFIISRFVLNPIQRAHIKKRISNLRYAFVAALMHDIRRGKAPNMMILVRQFSIDPMTYVYFLPNCIKICFSVLKESMLHRNK